MSGTPKADAPATARTRVAVVGSRTFGKMEAVRQFVNSLPPDTVVVSGGARGVDTVAVEAARQRGLAFLEINADWHRHGKRAGFIRNAEIVANADEVVAFRDGSSKGTAHTISLAEKTGRPVRVIMESVVAPSRKDQGAQA